MPEIKQTVTFNARPSLVFQALMDSKMHSDFTGAPAKIGAAAGQPFTAFGGNITGYNLEVTKNKTIVQAWRAKSWPKGTWSVVSFRLAAAKGGKTKLSFTHTGVPASSLKGITAGWKSSYWVPLKATIKTANAAAKVKKVPAPKKAAARRAKPAAAARNPAASARGPKSAGARRTTRVRAGARTRWRT